MVVHVHLYLHKEEMSPPQPSSRSEPSSSGPNPASLEEQRNPDRRAGLQANQIENSATTLAWRRARDTYRTTLTDKEFKRIMIPVGPDDVLKEIEKWQNRQRKSKFSKVADGVQAGVSHLQKFNRAVDLIAQGTPAPGCLIWGSVLFALTVRIPCFIYEYPLGALTLLYVDCTKCRRGIPQTLQGAYPYDRMFTVD